MTEEAIEATPHARSNAARVAIDAAVIGTDELVRLVGDGLGLTASAATAQRMAVSDLQRRRVVADVGSEGSQWLRELIAASPELLTEEAKIRLAAVQIFAVDSYYPNAVARLADASQQIIVFDGLRHLVHFFADYITVLALLLQLRPNAVIDDGEGGAEPEALLFSLACFSVLAHFLATNLQPALLHDLLGDVPRKNVEIGYRTAVLFVLLHELGHVELGHLDDGPLSETSHIALIEPEDLHPHQADELAADAFAIGCFAPAYRAEMISSLMFLLGSYALLEAFHGGLQASHPLAINRLAALTDASGLSSGDRAIAMSWIGDRVLAFRRMAADRETAGDGSIADRISSAMPVERANAIIWEIRRRVQTDHGVLSPSQE